MLPITITNAVSSTHTITDINSGPFSHLVRPGTTTLLYQNLRVASLTRYYLQGYNITGCPNEPVVRKIDKFGVLLSSNFPMGVLTPFWSTFEEKGTQTEKEIGMRREARKF